MTVLVKSFKEFNFDILIYKRIEKIVDADDYFLFCYPDGAFIKIPRINNFIIEIN